MTINGLSIEPYSPLHAHTHTLTAPRLTNDVVLNGHQVKVMVGYIVP